MKVSEYNGATMDIDNGRGSDRLLDIYLDKTDKLLRLTLNAVSGGLEIEGDNSRYKLSEYQVRCLIEFLQQRD